MIIVRAEPKYLIELSLDDAKMLCDLARTSRYGHEASIHVDRWFGYIDLLADAESNWRRIVTATPAAIAAVIKMLAFPGPRQPDLMRRISALHRFFSEAEELATQEVKKVEMNLVFIDHGY